MTFNPMLLRATLALAILALGCESIGTSRIGHRDPAPSALRGRIEAASEPSGPVLVYLEPIGLRARKGGRRGGESRESAPKTIALRRHSGALEPHFWLASIGQVLIFSNQDELHHSLFSYSEPNAFESGTLAAGETRPITFAAAGPVSFYCSLHDSEHGVIFVAPSDHSTIADAQGRYSFVAVPPGRYRLRAWTEGQLRFDREITLKPGESAWRSIALGGEARPG